MKILVVEDEEALASGLKFNFEQENYEVVVAADGPTALEHFEQADPPFDLVILDLMLPGLSGYETCRAIRQIDDRVPVLVLSARTLSEDKAMAFDCGTDQYVTKPFALPELISRVRNLTERRRQNSSGTQREKTKPELYSFGKVTVDFRKFELSAGGKTQRLTTMELELLRYFIEHEGHVLSRHQILRDVWGVDSDVTTRTIDNFVLRLRKLIDTGRGGRSHIVSVWGTGYQFLAEPAADSNESPSSPG